MEQVLIRARALLGRPRVLLVALGMAGGGSALVLLPLLGVPGLELALAVTLLVGTLGGAVGIAAARLEARLVQGRNPRPPGALRHDAPLKSACNAVGAAFLVNALAVAIPFLASVAFALVRSPCNPFAQVLFYPLLTLPSALLAAAAGALCGWVSQSRFRAVLLYGLLLALSAVWTVWPVWKGPQIFAFNFFGGYFPGPLYDETLRIRAGLLWFRLETVLWAAALVTGTSLCLNMREGRLTRPHVRLGSALLLGLFLVGIGTLELRAPELGFRATDDFVSAKLGGLRTSDHFVIHYPRGKRREDVERLVRDLEFRHHQLQTFLGPGTPSPIRVFVYRSAEEKQTLVGAATTQFAVPWRQALHINDASFPHPVLKHELTHVMAAPFGSGPFQVTSRVGVIPLMSIVEGFAVAGDNPTGDLTLQEWAAAMRRQKLAPDVRALFRLEGFYQSSGPRAYTVAGAFLRYLAETYGTDKLKTLYARGDFFTAYGRPLDALATEWEKHVDALPLEAQAVNRAFSRFREASLFARPCAREVASLEEEAGAALASDPAEALKLYERCGKLQPDEPGFTLGEARALGKLDRAAEGMERLRALQSRVAGKPSLEAEVALAEADLAYQRNRPQEAAQALERVLALKPGPDFERTAEVKLAATADPKVGAALWQYFQPGAEEVRLLKLRVAWESARENPFLNYLLGRRLLQAGEPRLSAQHLTLALAQTLPESIQREAERLRLQALYEAGDCPGVEDALGHLPDLGVAFRAQSEEWRERCDFERTAFHGALVPSGDFR